MNLIKFTKTLIRNIKFLILIPIIVAGIVYLLTKDMPNIYKAETSIFTGITSNNGLELGAVRIDNNATKNAYDNVITIFESDLLFEEVSLHLLTQHLMLSKAQKDIISEEAFKQLNENVPSDVKKLIVKGNFEKTYSNLKTNIVADKKNYIYSLLNYTNPYYSISAISRLEVKRISNSDLIQISYESSDPAIAYNTIKFASEIFIKKYSLLKVSQSNDAVAYFEKKLAEMTLKLNAAEDKLLKFNIDNVIINYYEQTEQVTTQQEKIELRLQETKMEYESSVAVLNKLEKEVESRFKINLKNKEVFAIRRQLADYNLQIARAEVDENISKTTLNDFKLKKTIAEKTLENKIDSITIFDTKGQGIESQRILSAWLDAVKSVESNNALFKSMKERIIEFMKEFKKYAPLGATIKRIEREIDINEREYLYILGQLGLAKQKQQNTDMVSNMKVIDEPKIPLNPIPSKKKLYVIIAAIFSVILYILALFIVELLDSRIKSPSHLKTLTDLDVLGAYCIYGNKKITNTEKITEKASIFIREKIQLLSKVKPFLTESKNCPFTIQILSNWDNSGKTHLANLLNQEFEKTGLSLKILNFKDLFVDKIENQDNENSSEINSATIKNNFLTLNSYSDLFSIENIETQYIISILPSISNGILNSSIIKTADINLIAFDANTTWVDADNYYLNKIKHLIENPFYAILTNALPDDIEEMYGEIPKKRSFFRIFIKKSMKNIS